MTSVSTRKSLNFIVLAIVFGAGVVASASIFYAFSLSERDDKKPEIASNEAISKPVNSVEEASSSDEIPANTIKAQTSSLYDIEKLGGPFERNMALFNVLMQIEEDQLLNMLEQSKQQHSTTRVQTQAAILQRLVSFNPSKALSEALQFHPPRSHHLLTAIFSEWARVNLKDAISHATTLEDDGKRAALEGILHERNDLTDAERREIAVQLGNEQIAVHLFYMEKLSESNDYPSQLWNEITEGAQNDSAQFEILLQIAHVWVEKKGLQVLDQIIATFENSRTQTWFLNTVLREVAQSDPSDALQYALQFDRYPLIESNKTVIREWATFDPRAALNAISAISKEGLRDSLTRELVELWATDKPREILADMESIPTRFTKLVTQTAISQIAESSPQDAASIVSSIEEWGRGYRKVDAAATVVDHWLARDIDATLDWIVSDPGLGADRSWVRRYASFSLVDYDLERAMQFALEQPIGENETGPEAWVVAELARKDMDKALEYMAQVRDGPTKIQAYKSVGFELIESRQTDAALKLAQQIPEYAKGHYLSQIFALWTNLDPTGLFESLDQMPSAAVTSRAALYLLIENRRGEYLTPEQIETVTDFLTNEDSTLFERSTMRALPRAH
ncbi:MAG: hypothetical protein F4W92_09545 [Gammaproteobacteria bacterium]|nr:hypothetical protein [Gammaproteobacteria bacterium]